jgi:asparagine synthase (glutamine-hydrolysing)
MIWATDDLFSDPANVPTSWLAQATAKDVKVVLTGEGGDEVFAGYGRYRRHPLHYFGKGLMDAGCGFHLYGIFNDRAAKEIFNPALYDAARFWRKPLQEEWRNYPRQWSRLQRMQGIDIDGEMANVLLPKVDRMLMSWGVEGRVPFLDHRVVEFGLSLPDSMKISGRNGKVFLKKWGERYLSCDDIWGKKKGFAVPLGKMFNNTFLGKLSGILPRSGAVTALLQPDGVKALVNRQRTQGDVSNQLWRILVLAIWYKLHIEGDSSRPPAKMDLLELLG